MSEEKPKVYGQEEYEKRINDEFQQKVNPKCSWEEHVKLKEAYLKRRGEK